jgi:O-methyltransferase
MTEEPWLGPISNHNRTFKELLDERAAEPGVILEFGVYNGGSTRALSDYAPERWVYAFDTFEGMPSTGYDPKLDHDEPGKFRPLTSIGDMFKGYPKIIAIVGEFKNTLPALALRNRKAQLVYLDCDLYASYKTVLDWLPDNLAHRAAIVVDDYQHCKGARKAMDEWMEKFGLRFEPRYAPDEQVIVWPYKDNW